MERRSSLQPRTYAELKEREAERGEPFKRLGSGSLGRSRKHAVALDLDRGTVTPAPIALAAAAPPEQRNVTTAQPARTAAPIVKRAELESGSIREAVRSMPCYFCGKPPRNTIQHFPAKGGLGLQNDLLGLPACGDGVSGCHGRCQRYEILPEYQCEAVGRTMALHLRAGRCSWPDVEGALAAVDRLDYRKMMRAAIIEALAVEPAAGGAVVY